MTASFMARTLLRAIGITGVLLSVITSQSSLAQSRPIAESAVRSKADALIAQMTPEEKAGQLSQYFYINHPMLAKVAEEALNKGEVGSFLFVSDPVEANRLQRIAVEKTRLKIPVIFGFDVIHGLQTVFPVPIAMAASWDPALAEEAQRVASKEARAVGIHWTFAPNVDIARDSRWGRIVEGAGEDPYLGSKMGAAQVRGFQGPFIGAPDHVISGPKHFAGYGASLGGRDYDEVNLSENDLWNVYLPPFKAAIDAGAGNIMSAYMGLNGVPAAGNEWLLTDVLRKTLGFKGFVVSDAGAVDALTIHGLTIDAQHAATRAVKAGVNMEMAPPGQLPAMRTLPAALKAGEISESEIDNAVRGILSAKIRMGLFENPYVDEKKSAAILNDRKHLVSARIAAERSAVLLRNDTNLLPLDRKNIKTVAVIGPLADSARDTLGPWVSLRNNPQAVSVLAGLRSALGNKVRVDYSEGVRIPQRLNPSIFDRSEPPVQRPALDENTEIQHAVELTQNADVTILVLGETQNMIGEMASRSSFDLPGRQQELLDKVVATGKPVVLVLMSGRPLDFKDSQVSTILNIWYPGSQGGIAAANLLLGDAVPGGKLPFTWIRNASQAPLHYAHLISHDPANTDKRYLNESNTPTFVFGYGLSYTTFEYSDVNVERPSYSKNENVKVTVNLKNTGKRTGDEVAQLYIHQRYGTSARPIRELKGFQRVSLRSGESRQLSFTLTPQDLSYWSAVTKSWVNDDTAFDLWVGGSSSAELAGSFEIKDTTKK